jgi:hypothetical protein
VANVEDAFMMGLPRHSGTQCRASERLFGVVREAFHRR